MATVKLTLTTTPQEVAGSSLGCTVFPTGACLYGAGTTDPGVYVMHDPMETDRIVYNGDYGSLWFKEYSVNADVEIIVMKA